MPIRSYARSTDYHRKPCGENILCGIDISVVMCPTLWTIPLPNIERQFINDVTAMPTALRTGEPTVNLNQCSTVPLALVFQFGMDSSNFMPCFLSIIRAFNLTRQSFLSLSQLVTKAFEMFGVSNFLPVTSRNQGGDTCVNPYRFIDLRQCLNGKLIKEQRHKPASRRIQLDGNSKRFATIWQSSTPANWQG